MITALIAACGMLGAGLVLVAGALGLATLLVLGLLWGISREARRMESQE